MPIAALLEWLVFSVAFGLMSYFFTMLDQGIDPKILFGDGSLIMLSLSLVVAAGATAFKDASKIRAHGFWFAAFAGVLVALSAGYAKVREDLNDADEMQVIESADLREALRSEYQSTNDELPSADTLGNLVAGQIGRLESDLRDADLTTEPHRILPLKEDALRAAWEPITTNQEQANESARAAVESAESQAAQGGALALLAGLPLGATVVLVVNSRP